MITDHDIRVTPQIAHDLEQVKKYMIHNHISGIHEHSNIKIIKRSIDARQRNVMVNLKVRILDPHNEHTGSLITPIVYGNIEKAPQVIIVGAGPAGLFAGLRLIEKGLKPIIIERGKDVDERRKDLAKISRDGIINPDSNYCFGEGGAGAYSDGKLYTRSKKRGSVSRILSILHQHGASEDIMIDAHPHIGSDKLPIVIKSIRKTILNSGGEIHFNTRVNNIIVENGNVTGVECENGNQYSGDIILATGHSARDVYHFLNDNNITLEAKGIAVGVRLEHPQHIIDCIQYHSKDGKGKYLPAAEYSFVTQVDGRGVYSFCMCPGGFIVPAASAPDQLVVNGMSPSNRGTKWANSGMVVEVQPDDIKEYKDAGVLKVMKFQEAMEATAYREANKSQKAGAQRMIDFVNGTLSSSLPDTSYAPGITSSRLDRWLPPMVSNRLKKGFVHFGKSAKGFLTNEAILIGVETRTSSPVRIPRDQQTMAHINHSGLYPCGEGAGYAGGIVSAAIDGEKCAEAIAAKFNL